MIRMTVRVRRMSEASFLTRSSFMRASSMDWAAQTTSDDDDLNQVRRDQFGHGRFSVPCLRA
jgi:hypothetical protein